MTLPIMLIGEMPVSCSVRNSSWELRRIEVLQSQVRLALFFNLRFQSFTKPLLHHALIIKETGTGNALNAGKQPRVEAQCDGG